MRTLLTTVFALLVGLGSLTIAQESSPFLVETLHGF